MFTLLASDSFVSKKSVNTYPICDSPVWRTGAAQLRSVPGGVRTTTAMHCGFKIFKMAAKVEKFHRLYALFFNRYSSFLR